LRYGTVSAVSGGLGAVVDAKFGEDRADVVAYGFGADTKGGGDVGVAVAGGEQFEHVALATAAKPGGLGARGPQRAEAGQVGRFDAGASLIQQRGDRWVAASGPNHGSDSQPKSGHRKICRNLSPDVAT
jgi:hypothetical protein